MTIKDEAAKKKQEQRPPAGYNKKKYMGQKKALGSVKGTLDLVSKSTLDRSDATILE